MSEYIRIFGGDNSITCDNCSNVVVVWHANDFHAICTICYLEPDHSLPMCGDCLYPPASCNCRDK